MAGVHTHPQGQGIRGTATMVISCIVSEMSSLPSKQLYCWTTQSQHQRVLQLHFGNQKKRNASLHPAASPQLGNTESESPLTHSPPGIFRHLCSEGSPENSAFCREDADWDIDKPLFPPRLPNLGRRSSDQTKASAGDAMLSIIHTSFGKAQWVIERSCHLFWSQNSSLWTDWKNCSQNVVPRNVSA